MKLTAKVKLKTTLEQHQALSDTLELANFACNQISEIAWDKRIFSQFKLHHLVYYPIRKSSGLSAQVTVRCISKVSDSYKKDKTSKHTFRSHGSIAYDSAILSWKLDKSLVSIWTTKGRLKIQFVTGQPQLELLKYQHGESDLVYWKKEFYLFTTCEIEDPEEIDPIDVLGIDLGIVNIATTSDGHTFTGNHVSNVRYRYSRLRRKLQAKQTKSAKRRLKKLSGKEARFATHTNHVISKSIVATAQGTNRAIAVEKLTGIRSKVTARRSQRATLHSWSFYQLKGFISYKAQLSGVPLIEVDPRNTSRTCPACGCVNKHNRRSQSSFICVQCGLAGLADHFAAVEIGRRGAVSHPYISITSIIVSPKMGMIKAN